MEIWTWDGPGTLLFPQMGGNIKGLVSMSDIVLVLELNHWDNTRHFGDNDGAQWTYQTHSRRYGQSL